MSVITKKVDWFKISLKKVNWYSLKMLKKLTSSWLDQNLAKENLAEL